MLQDIPPISVDRTGKRDRSTNKFPTGLLHYDGSRRNGQLPTKAEAHVHKVGSSGLYTKKLVNILTYL